MHLQMSWDIKTCRLTDNSVEEISGSPVSKYNPFDHNRKNNKELYLEFVSIDENNPQSILKFINLYGFLGFKYDKERNYREELKQYENENELKEMEQELFKKLTIGFINETIDAPFSAWDTVSAFRNDAENKDNNLLVNDSPKDQSELLLQLLERHPPESEKLEDIKQEIITMRCLVLLWQALKANNREGILGQMENLYSLRHESDEQIVANMNSLREFNDSVVRYLVAKLLSQCVNEKLQGVNPLLSSSLNDERCFTSSWYAPHLLSAMYVMFYMDLTRGIILRKCHNQTCKGFFSIYGNDERKIYCNESCASSQKQREYRRRKKEQKLIENNRL